MSKEIITLDPIIGYPPLPSLNLDDLAAMPIVTIVPCVPDFTLGTSVYELKEVFNKEDGSEDVPSYLDMLERHGYTLPGTSLNLAYLADSFPTDTFTNEYGPSMLEGLTGNVSNVGANVSQMFGKTTATGTVSDIGAALSGSENAVAKGAGAAVQGLNNILGGIGKAAGKMSGPNGFFTNAGQTVNKLLAGGRIDFPDLWKGSGFKPSYTITVRLFNPKPYDASATRQYIIGPIAAILLLATPISDSGYTFNWPYCHKIESSGIFSLQSAFINSITVIKGGDQLQIGYNQSLGLVDVRIEFSSLFGTMIALKENDTNENSGRPNLYNYLETMEGEKTFETEDEILTATSSGDGTITAIMDLDLYEYTSRISEDDIVTTSNLEENNPHLY